MKVLGIIAEFNPFHKGHKYLIEQAKKASNADACIIVMSGNFVQRGEPAIMDKFSRAQIALKCGADLVVELPTFISTASAEGFAHGAVSLLNQLNIIDYLAFGTEVNNMSMIDNIAEILVNEPDDFKGLIKKSCEEGVSYPASRSHALLSILPDDIKSEAEEILSYPNSILAIEYLKSLKRLNSDITAITIQRIGAGYNDCSSHNDFSSASGIRCFIKKDEAYTNNIPAVAYTTMKEYESNRGYIFEEDVFPLLFSKLLTKSNENIGQYIDSNEFIANKIKNKLYNVNSYSQLIEMLTSKDYTVSRIKRVLTHILLNIDKKLLKENNYNDYTAQYARILACKNEQLLSELCKKSSIPVIVKLSTQESKLNNIASEHLKIDKDANNLYQSMITSKYGHTPLNEYTQNIFPIKNG